jgi:hypothetical protein
MNDNPMKLVIEIISASDRISLVALGELLQQLEHRLYAIDPRMTYIGQNDNGQAIISLMQSDTETGQIISATLKWPTKDGR